MKGCTSSCVNGNGFSNDHEEKIVDQTNPYGSCKSACADSTYTFFGIYFTGRWS